LLIALVAAVTATALIFLSYNTDLSQARDAASRSGRIATTSAGPIEYAEKGVGIPLLSIHGAGGGCDQGLANVADIVGDGFRVIAPSRFGYLGTPVPSDRSLAAQADAHAALLSKLKVDKAIVVGTSAGARSAVELAVRHSERVAGLILIVPATYAPASPVAVEESRTSALVLWLVNNGADFAWWATEKIAPSILIRAELVVYDTGGHLLMHYAFLLGPRRRGEQFWPDSDEAKSSGALSPFRVASQESISTAIPILAAHRFRTSTCRHWSSQRGTTCSTRCLPQSSRPARFLTQSWLSTIRAVICWSGVSSQCARSSAIFLRTIRAGRSGLTRMAVVITRSTSD